MATDQDGGGYLGQPDGEHEGAITLVMRCWDINWGGGVVRRRRGVGDEGISP